MISPSSVFETPEQVVGARLLSNDQKIEILLRWEKVALHEDVAVEEGMPDGDSDLVRRILVALGTLNAPIDMEHAGQQEPTLEHASALGSEPAMSITDPACPFPDHWTLVVAMGSLHWSSRGAAPRSSASMRQQR